MASNHNDSFFSANNSSNSISDDSFCSLPDTLGSFIRQTFCPATECMLNVCHINAQSIPSHHSELLVAFANGNVHAVLVSETWLKPHLISSAYSLPGYVLIRNDRNDRRGGGVAIYLDNSLNYKILVSSPPNYSATAEYLFLEVSVKGAKVILGVVYCPPSINYFSSIEPILESLGSEYAHHVIMGDLNTDLLRDTPRSNKLQQLIKSANLHTLPLAPTHHNIEGVDTWLDLILTSVPSLVHSYGQTPAPEFSHHDLIYLSYKLKPPKSQPKIMHMRCFGRIDNERLQQDAAALNWEPLIAASSVDEKVHIFNNMVLRLFDTHAPVRRVKLKRPPAPWMSRGIQMAMRRRNKAFRRFRRDRSDENWTLYKAARNRCNQIIRNAKRRHILDNLNSSSPAGVWKFLGTLGIGKQRLTRPGVGVGLDDLNQHFSTTPLFDHQTKTHTLNFLAGLSRPNIEELKFSPVAAVEVRKIILSIKSNAMGCDCINRRMIILILDHLILPISNIINSSICSSIFPSLWRNAFVIPLPKLPNPSLPSHYRPISILPFLSKVLEACVHRQLTKFVHRYDLLSSLQSGFRPGHSTTTALLKVTGDIRTGMEDAKVTVLVLVDFSNAFNTVSHDILLSVLSHLMISSNAREWFSSYLQGRQQSVRSDESSSNWCDVDSGVPQGGILSPLLFSLFINLLTCKLRCAFHLYADDLQLYTQATVGNVADAIADLNNNLEAVRCWSNRFGLTVNPAKCQAVIVGSHHMMCRLKEKSLPPVLFNGSVIPFSPSVKDLGLHIDSTLNWQAQVTNVSQKVTGILRTLYRLKNFLPSRTKTMLVQTLIFPVIDYGDVCYYDLNADLLDKFDRLLNNCIRFIYNLRKYDHVSTYRSELKWLPIRLRRKLRALTTLFSLLNSPSPPSYLASSFQYLCSTHERNLRSSHNLLLHCPSHSSGFINSSFVVQVIQLWNALPLEIRTSKNRFAFKVKVKALLFEGLM